MCAVEATLKASLCKIPVTYTVEEPELHDTTHT